MSKKSLFRFLLSIAVLFPLALGAGSPAHIEPITAEGACTLPAPTNFQVLQVGATNATIGWTATPGAWGYKVYLSSNGNPPTASGITTGTSMWLSGLDYNTVYSVKVYPLCSLTEPSTNYLSGSFTTIIIEIVCNVHETVTPDRQIYDSDNDYVFEENWDSESEYYFHIQNGNTDVGNIYFYRPAGTTSLKFSPMMYNLPNLYLGRVGLSPTPLYCDGENATGSGGFIKVKLGGTEIISGTQFSSTKLSLVPAYGSGYTITVFANNPNGQPAPPESADRDASQPPGTLTPSPNPFNEVLFLNGDVSDQPVQLHLFDAQGRLVQQREIDPAEFSEGSFALPTHDLAPGIYFLKLRSEAGCTTHKLLKM